MLSKTITYKDYNGETRTETFWFHLSKGQIAEMAVANNGFEEYLKTIIESKDGRAIMDTFRQILEMSVGVRSEDGRRFIRTPEYTEEFMQTEAYSELFIALVTDAQFGAEFVKGLLPADLAAQAEEQLAAAEREYTHQELLNMSDEEFRRVAGDDHKRMTRDHLLVAMERKNRSIADVRVPSAL
jgi:hypothetical protein